MNLSCTCQISRQRLTEFGTASGRCFLKDPAVIIAQHTPHMACQYRHGKMIRRQIEQSGDANKVRVYIGHENLVKIMDNSTLVMKTVRRGGHVVGTLGILGPTRMDYSRVIAMLDQLSSGIVDALGGGDTQLLTNRTDNNDG